MMSSNRPQAVEIATSNFESMAPKSPCQKMINLLIKIACLICPSDEHRFNHSSTFNIKTNKPPLVILTKSYEYIFYTLRTNLPKIP